MILRDWETRAALAVGRNGIPLLAGAPTHSGEMPGRAVQPAKSALAIQARRASECIAGILSLARRARKGPRPSNARIRWRTPCVRTHHRGLFGRPGPYDEIEFVAGAMIAAAPGLGRHGWETSPAAWARGRAAEESPDSTGRDGG